LCTPDLTLSLKKKLKKKSIFISTPRYKVKGLPKHTHPHTSSMAHLRNGALLSYPTLQAKGCEELRNTVAGTFVPTLKLSHTEGQRNQEQKARHDVTSNCTNYSFQDTCLFPVGTECSSWRGGGGGDPHGAAVRNKWGCTHSPHTNS